MTTTIQKWGNSQGIRLPKQILDMLSWGVNDMIEIKAQENSIIIEPVRTSKRKTIAELFADYDDSYTAEEPDWGEPVGKEIW